LLASKACTGRPAFR